MKVRTWQQRPGQNEFTLKNRLRDLKSSQIVNINTSYDTEHLKKVSNRAIVALFRGKVENSLKSGDVLTQRGVVIHRGQAEHSQTEIP